MYYCGTQIKYLFIQKMEWIIIHIKYNLAYLTLDGFLSKNNLSEFETLNNFWEDNGI